MKKIIIMTMLLLLVIIPIVNAQIVVPTVSSEPYLKQNTPATLPLPCTIGGSYCSNTATCNTTILNPNSDILYNSFPMTQNGVTFEINLTASDTSVLGEYQFNVVCCDLGSCASRNLRFHVTPTGDSRGNTVILLLLIGSFLLLLFAFYIHNEFVGFFAGAGFLVSGIYAMINGVAGLNDFYTQTVSYVSLGIGLIICITAGYEASKGFGGTDEFGESERWV